MAAAGPTSPSTLPEVPVKHNDFLSHVAANPNSPMRELIEPYKRFDSKIREVFAQEPDHPALTDPFLNITPVFTGQESNARIRARDLATESDAEKEKYIMPLDAEQRKPNGSPAVVQSLKEFQTNFNIFSESSLVDLDWSNVVAAGSSVVTPLLPVPKEYSDSKRALRQYYHDVVAPASDVDLFLYGLSEEDALEKIKQIERKVKDSILAETTTIRTKHAITIASQYPTRHVQIVLRIYKSVAEILTGFDVDCSCAAYDGNQVYASPRALAAFMTQVNTIDLTRRSPSYENRLSKYSHRGFEVYWPNLDRSRIDPTIFERNFARTLGLARLLVLERLPNSSDRDDYMDQRRRERGRPEINRYARARHGLRGNIKEKYEDEVAEWVEEDEVADYHTFTIPYGEKFHARKIEKLLYTKDLLLNAEWNKPKEREVNLHRHPAFFGHAEDVFFDCCGYCPKPDTPEEEEVAEEESKTYVSGKISFIKDDPGRQTIGSFNPLTDNDWTEMAYVGNTARLCQAIVDGDLDHVEDWLSQEGADPNTRDYTGRTPLHLACHSSSPEIVQRLVDAGARMVARLADGRTALHLAAARGSAEIVRVLMKRSEANEEEEANKADLRRKSRLAAKEAASPAAPKSPSDTRMASDEEDAEMIDNDEDDDDVEMKSTTTGSYVNVKKSEDPDENDNLPEDNEEEPDVYDVNVLAWDTPSSPLHLAIFNGHCEVVKELVQNFGADVLLPVKLLNSYNRKPSAAILTLCLATHLPLDRAKEMIHTLLEVGASSAQADLHGTTAFHRFTAQQTELIQALLDHDLPGAKRALNHLACGGLNYRPFPISPLSTAIDSQNTSSALKLLETGARPEIGFQEFVDAWASMRGSYYDKENTERNTETYRENTRQPVIVAVQNELPDVVLQLLKHGANPSTLTSGAWRVVQEDRAYDSNDAQTLLDVVRKKLKELRGYDDKINIELPKPAFQGSGQEYIDVYGDGSYQQWVAVRAVQRELRDHESSMEGYKKALEEAEKRKGLVEKREAVEKLCRQFESVERELLAKGAKTFLELYPDFAPKKRAPSSVDEPREKEEPWKVDFSFRIPDLTDKKREGYIELFDAAWKGDLLAIKRLTLTLWGELRDQLPLKIAVTDSEGLSPLQIAVLRGHIDCAEGILEIAKAQYKPKEKNQERYSMEGDEDSDYESSQASEASEDEDKITVFREIVDDQFTIENIGEVATQVRSSVSPLTFLDWGCTIPRVEMAKKESSVIGLASHPLTGEWQSAQSDDLVQYAIEKDDLGLLKTLLQWGAQYTAQYSKPDGEETTVPFYTRNEDDLIFAMRLGRISCLTELIKRTGVGLPLDKLIKRSGVEIIEKPRYYQGLSIHGKKRADWAAAGRGVTPQRASDEHPPLLQAAKTGNLEAIEWFLSDAPTRCYAEFAEENKADKRLQHLAKANGGIQRAISDWLDLRQKLVLHCAVMAPWKSDETPKVLDYLVRAIPKTLETKANSTGQTPLHLACSLGRYVTAKRLIAAGADQTCRDSSWNNIIHTLLSSWRYKDIELFKMLELVDQRLLESLFTERNSDAATPLALWLRVYANESSGKILEHLLSLSPTLAELDMVDGVGDTPLHIVTKRELTPLMRIIIDRRPELLYRENATGRTPAEMAGDSWTSKCFENPPKIPRDPTDQRWYWFDEGTSDPILARDSEKFLPKDEGHEDEQSTPWELCRERWESDGKAERVKRKLVSLNEANEVARRLGKRQKHARRGRKTRDDDGESQSEEDTPKDEVASWYGPSWCEFEYDEDGKLLETE